MNIVRMMVPKALTVCLRATDNLRRGMDVMRDYGYTAIPVLDDQGRFLGCVNDRDFLRFIITQGHTDPKDYERCTVGEIMRRDFSPPVTITDSEDKLVDAALEQNFVPVVDDRGCLCGIVTRRMIIAELAGRKINPLRNEFDAR